MPWHHAPKKKYFVLDLLLLYVLTFISKVFEIQFLTKVWTSYPIKINMSKGRHRHRGTERRATHHLMWDSGLLAGLMGQNLTPPQ